MMGTLEHPLSWVLSLGVDFAVCVAATAFWSSNDWMRLIVNILKNEFG